MNRHKWDKFDWIPLLTIVLLVGHIACVAVNCEVAPSATVSEEDIPGAATDSNTLKTADLPTTRVRH